MKNILKDIRVACHQLSVPEFENPADLVSWMGVGLDISEDLYSRCNDLIEKMLTGNHYFTREEIETVLGREGIPTADDRVKRYILRAEMEGIICSGRD